MTVLTHPLVRIARLGRPRAGRLWLALLLGTLTVGASIGLMATSGYLISRAAQQPPILELGVAIVAVRFFGVSRGVLRYLDRLCSHDAALRSIATLRVHLFRRLEPLVPGGLAGVRTGDLLGRFVADVDVLQSLYLRALGPIGVGIGASAIAVSIAALVLPAAGAVLAAGLIVSGLLVPVAGTALARLAVRAEAPARAALTAGLLDALAAAPELVAYGAAADAAAGIEAAERRLAGHRRRTALVAATTEAAITTLTLLTVVALIAVSAVAVGSGALAGIELAMLALLALASFEAVRPLPGAAEQLVAVSSASRRLVDLTDREAPVVDPAAPCPPARRGDLSLRGVRMSWTPGARPALDGIDLDLPAGSIVALVGPSGSGKSTLACLLARFRDPDAGAILLDGRDLRDYAQADVRRAVCLAGQEAHLFPTSIRENLRIARPGADDDELGEALRRARCLDWVAELPDGLDTQVGENGARVSGGQRQRLALARAFLAEARLLVLDEPDVHLDEATADALVRDLLASARAAGLGVLLITHRPVPRELVDRVEVLREGRIVRT